MGRGWTRAVAIAAGIVACLAGPVPAVAQLPPPLTVPQLGGFRSVLAQGEGQSVNAADLAAYEASGKPPDTFVNQQPLYVGIMPRAATLKPPDLNVFYKNSSFGSMPGGVGSVTTPAAGVQIFRDKRFGMAHVYGSSRANVMFGAGYATAQERLFLMDAVRHTAEGTLAELTGPSAAPDDSAQLTDQDFSLAELTAQFDALPRRYGAIGARAHRDILDYVAGINKRIDEVNASPAQLPAEYAALGTKPRRWTPADTAAEAVLLVTQFTVSNGGEEINAQLQGAFRKRFGKAWPSPYHDLREAQDPEAFTVAKRRFPSDNPGPVRPGLNAMPDLGSIQRRNTIVKGPGAGSAASAGASMPAWVRSVNGLKQSLPTVESNAVMVPRRMSSTGHALAAMGPQVGYYSPQIFSEYELHGGGIDVEGVSFPGAAPLDRPRDRLRVERHQRQRRQRGHVRGAPLQPRRLGGHQEEHALRLQGSLPRVHDARPDGHDAVLAARPDQPATADHLPHHALRARPGVRVRQGAPSAGRAREGQGRGLPGARRGAPVHASGRERTDGRALVPEGDEPVPRHRELVLRRSQGRGLPPVRVLPAPRPRQRSRPSVLGRWPRRLAGLRSEHLQLQLDPAVASPAGDQPDRRQGAARLLEQQGGARLAEGPDRVEQRSRAPREDPPGPPRRPGRRRRTGRST